MYCWKCGDELVSVRGELTCVRGNMGLSPRMTRLLTDCFITQTREPLARPFPGGLGDDYFCPGCGERMRGAEEWVIRCPRCSRSLNEFVYELIRLNPHDAG